MGNFARSLGLARVTPVVGGYGFGSPHSLAGAIPVISSDPWIARRGAQHGGGRKRVVTAVTAATVVTAVTAELVFTNASHPVPPYDTYHITLSDFALRPPMSGYNGWESTHKHEHSSLYSIC